MIRYYGFDNTPIITEDEQKFVVDWVRKNCKFFDANGYNRYKKHLDFFPNVPSVFDEVKQRIIKKENLYGYRQEPIFRDSIAYMLDGGKLHLHKDPNRDGLIHVRFNVYVQIPEQGGYPIYGNKLCTLTERTYICCVAGRDFHECSQVVGKRERIMISYGFLIPEADIGTVVYNYPDIELFEKEYSTFNSFSDLSFI